ncbi:MAG: toxin-antitoxin system YwqK family antitoxin [Bacteroidales bacterium]|nr:toxin-antitoxin system YwqK family antitoxin [Bacteroidales bacterium]
MNKASIWGWMALLCCMAVACRQPVEKRVVSRYADNRPRVVQEYITVNDSAVLHKEIHYFPGEKKYMEKNYDETGKPDGVWVSWYENGNKNSEGTYRDGQWQGVYKVWHPNGKLFYSGEYDRGKRVGIWKFYDSTGVLVRTEECTDKE